VDPLSAIPAIELLVYPDDCDSFGHVNQATFLRLFEHARWQAVARGPGIDIFSRSDAWPAVRKTKIEYFASAFAGDRLRFDTDLTHLGRTSFSMHQTAKRGTDDTLVAEADFVFVCVRRDGTPTPVPDEIARFLGARPSLRPGEVAHLRVRGVLTGLDVQGDGSAVLFVHGFPLDRTMWRDLMGALTGWRRVAPDLRGLGMSDAPQTGYSMSEYADDLAALMDLLEIKRAVICGLSMGGYVTFEFLRRHPDRVRAIMLLNTRADADSEEGKASRDMMISSVRSDGVGILEDLMVHRLLAHGSLKSMPQLGERLRAMIRGHTELGVVGALEAMKVRNDATELLAHIAVPALVVAGKEDRMIPLESSQSLARAIPGAQFTVIPEAGHLTPMEQPIATGRVIREFLESLS
jgi:3-oxoadipate enol-lactonase